MHKCLLTGMVEALLQHLEGTFGFAFVSHAFGYISVAKHGLTEVELLDILSSDKEVRRDNKCVCL